MSETEKVGNSSYAPPAFNDRLDSLARIESSFFRTMVHAETAFKVNITLNIIVAGVGLAILTYSIVYSWVNGLDLYATAFGSLGVASFIALFYFSPQDKVQKTASNLAQLQMLFRSYFMQIEEINDFCYRHNPRSVKELERIDKHLTESTCYICQKIEELVEKGTNKSASKQS